MSTRLGALEGLNRQLDIQPTQLGHVSVVIPCLNEAENIVQCVTNARAAVATGAMDGEVIVVDNGSTDDSGKLARAAGATVVVEPRRGYGQAYLAGLAKARGEFIIMGDADQTYDFGQIPAFVARLEAGADVVIGDRRGGIQPGAMPRLHRYLGNPAMTALVNALFGCRIRDVWCGLRAVRRDALPKLNLKSPGMEFAIEMIISASKAGLAIDQVPIKLYKRGGVSKLSTFRDGWRALRFILVHSPTHLFLIPGVACIASGALIMMTVLSGVSVLGRAWSIHAMVGGCLLLVVGSQIVSLGVCARVYGIRYMREREPWFERIGGSLRLEHGLLAGGFLMAAGIAAGVGVLVAWLASGFGSPSKELLALTAMTLFIVGTQIFFTSFLISILNLARQSTTYGAPRAHVELDTTENVVARQSDTGRRDAHGSDLVSTRRPTTEHHEA